jgi:CBS-domain-containing membrane protein
MVDKKTNSLIVVDKDNKPVGVLSSFTLAKTIVPTYLSADPMFSQYGAEGTFDKYANKIKDLKISEIMHKNFHALSEDDTMIEASSYSIADERRTLPVVNKEGILIGAISRTSVKNALYNVIYKDDPIDPHEDACKFCKST